MRFDSGVYDKLEQKYHLVGDKHFRAIIETLMTPDEGAIILELSAPMTPAELAVRMNSDENELNKKLDNMARRGLLFRGKEQYIAWGDAHQLNVRVMFSSEEHTSPEYLELRKKDMRYEESPFSEIHFWLRIYEKTGKPLIRIIPSRLAILANPDIKPEDVLWYEDMAELLRRVDAIGVVDCDCRRIHQKCDKPLFTCMHFGRKFLEYETGRGSRMKLLSYEEALAISDDAEQAGLVHNTPFNCSSVPGVICHCCNDCCSTFEPALHAGKVNQVAAPSRYRPEVNPELCIGCKQCLKRCPFGAVEMDPIPDSKALRAGIIAEKCLGCGICVLGCKQNALTYMIVRPPEFIPAEPALPLGEGINIR
jgi:Pyruvate/2-oxoacid:ferredoxin oxidoreductase delta subunit